MDLVRPIKKNEKHQVSDCVLGHKHDKDVYVEYD